MLKYGIKYTGSLTFDKAFGVGNLYHCFLCHESLLKERHVSSEAHLEGQQNFFSESTFRTKNVLL